MLAQLHNFKQDLAAAFVLLTRIPLPNACLRDVPPDIIASVWAFPVVGAVIGGAGAIGFALAVTIGLPATASAVIAAAIMVLLTGGFHDDGLADVADGFGGGQTRERKLEIMRDSRIGAYGMLAIILVMGLRVSGFTALSIEQVFAASIISAMLSRMMMVFVMKYMQPARQDGLAHDAGMPDLMRIGIGLSLCITVALVIVGSVATLLSVSAAGIACAIMGKIAHRQISGFTGDVLGAVQQLSEIAVLLTLVAYWN